MRSAKRAAEVVWTATVYCVKGAQGLGVPAIDTLVRAPLGALTSSYNHPMQSPESRHTENLHSAHEVRDYLSYLSIERGASPNTVSAYRRDLHSYVQFLASRQVPALRSVVQDDVLAFIAALRNSGLSPATIERRLSAVKGLHRFLVSEGLAECLPASDLPKRHRTERLPDVLTLQQVEGVLAAAAQAVDAPEAVASRNYAILELLYGCGIRVSELCNLDLGSVHLDDGLIRVIGKGSKERIAPMGERAAAALDQYVTRYRSSLKPARSTATPSAAVFLSTRGRRLNRESVYRIVRAAGERVGIEKLHPHTFRHSYATHMLEGGADLRSLQELLGHADLSTTQVYTHVDQRFMRTEYLRKHPRARD